MHISVACPRCQTRYQLDPNLLGKQMRCPNAMCRAVFEVREDGKQPPPAATTDKPELPTTPMSGSVGEVVPILTAEAVQPPSKPARRESTPAAGRPDIPASRVEKTPAKPKPAVEKPPGDTLRDLEDALAGDSSPVSTAESQAWDAPPPVRNARADGFTTGPYLAVSSTAPAPAGEPLASRTRRRMRRIVLGLLVLLVAGVGGVLFLTRGRQASDELEYSAKAEKLYNEREFADAAAMLQKLNREFPDSPEARRYRFLGELSDVREAVYHPQGDADETAKTHDRLLQFLTVYEKDPLLERYKADIEHSLLKVSRELVNLAQQTRERILLRRAEQALKEAGRFRTTRGPALDLEREIETELPKVASTIEAHEKRSNLIAELRRLANRPSGAAVRAARQLVHDAKFQTDPEISKLLQAVVQGHVSQVTYTLVFTPAESPPFEDVEATGAFVAPAIANVANNSGASISDSEAPVLGLTRGVLYALDARSGELRWARRVGADNASLPVYLPASPTSPGCYLVVSSDQKTLTAVNAMTGAPLWRQRLSGVPVGAPALVGRHVLIATASGSVDQIDAVSGTALGRFDVGQPMTVGLAVQPSSGYLFAFGDEFTVYVMDVIQQKCVGLLYSGHEAGSLVSTPLILPDPDPAPLKAAGTAAGWLVMTEVHDGNSRLRVFRLPLQTPDDAALPLDLQVKGWSWSGPYFDGEHLALATDAGQFAVWGVKQHGNRDAVVFPIFRNEALAGKASPGAAAVVHAHAGDFWIAASSGVQRVRLSISPETGPVGRMVWNAPMEASSFLHAAINESSRNGKLLALVRQTSHIGATSLVALDCDSGDVAWQRELGVVFVDEPIVAANVVWAHDGQKLISIRWKKDDAKTPTATIVPFSGEGNSFLIKGTGDKRIVLHQTSDKSLTTTLLAIEPAGDKGKLSFPLPSSCSGTPALGKGAVVVPLADGILTRLPLEGGPASQGPAWRGVGVDERQPGHVTALKDGDYVITDGEAGLQVVSWAEPKVWQKKASAHLSRRIIAPPAMVDDHRIAVGDSADTISLLGVERLNVIRQWSLGGKITQGPFVRGGRIGCVIGKNRLVWLDPDSANPAWEYAFVASIVGAPNLIDGRVIVADLAGNIVALDPATGETAGLGYSIRPAVAPATTPVSLGDRTLLVPLTDGSFLTLPLSVLTEATSSGRKDTP